MRRVSREGGIERSSELATIAPTGEGRGSRRRCLTPWFVSLACLSTSAHAEDARPDVLARASSGRAWSTRFSTMEGLPLTEVRVATTTSTSSPDADGPSGAVERFQVTVEGGASDERPRALKLFTEDARGRRLEARELRLRSVDCPGGSGHPAPAARRHCWASRALALVSSSVDRGEPRLGAQALLGAPGGRVVVEVDGVQTTLPVNLGLPSGEPSNASVAVRVSLLQVGPANSSALGTEASAGVETLTAALSEAIEPFATCGVVLDQAPASSVRLVRPPNAGVLTVGCEDGLPASGGDVRVATAAGEWRLETRPGEAPVVVAARLSSLFSERGLSVSVFRNPPVGGSADSSFDLVAREPGGDPVEFRVPQRGVLSSDPTLGVCLGRIDFGDGVTHFENLDSAAGTLEERALIRFVGDADPRTTDVIIIPEFGGTGRIGESFIASEGASIENVLLIDRSGIRALPRSMTIAHELGHVLLHLPGHPDDYGVDQPSHLMDADASDATAFGPRRLLAADCTRLREHSGPGALVPLLTPLPATQAKLPSEAPVSRFPPDGPAGAPADPRPLRY